MFWFCQLFKSTLVQRRASKSKQFRPKLFSRKSLFLGDGLYVVVADHGHHRNQFSFDSFKTKKEISRKSLDLIFQIFWFFLQRTAKRHTLKQTQNLFKKYLPHTEQRLIRVEPKVWE